MPSAWGDSSKTLGNRPFFIFLPGIIQVPSFQLQTEDSNHTQKDHFTSHCHAESERLLMPRRQICSDKSPPSKKLFLHRVIILPFAATN
jgi:hypothetical protein